MDDDYMYLISLYLRLLKHEERIQSLRERYKSEYRHYNNVDSVVKKSNVKDIYKTDSSSENEQPKTKTERFQNCIIAPNTKSVKIPDNRTNNPSSNTYSLYPKCFPSTYLSTREPSISTENFEREVKYDVLYRLLREGECVRNGLSAKNTNSQTDVVHHVATGSSGTISKYISTSTSLNGARNLLRLKKRSRHRYGCETIVRIDVRMLPTSVTIIDLTDRCKREQYVLKGVHSCDIINKFHRFASQFDEVLLEGHVPSYCLSLAN